MLPSTSMLPLKQALRRSGKRSLHDLLNLGLEEPIISKGPPGYSAVTGHTATVFGSTGFLGRYLVSKLGRMGTQVIVPFRDEDDKRHLKPMGDLGKIIPMEWDLRNETQIEECLKHSDIVYNLVGRNYETKNFDFDSVHVAGAERIAAAAARCGVPRLVHVSHLNASPDSKSRFYQSKAEGEKRVKSAFLDATIVRPGDMYGFEDKLLNNIASWPIWWKLNHGQTKIRPTHVLDVAQALTNLLHVPPVARTLNLPGPSTLTHEYLLELVSTLIYEPPSRAPVLPKAVAILIAKMGKAVWWPTLSPDQVERRYIDAVDTPGDWDVVGVTPEEIEDSAIVYLRRYRSAENYVRPVVFPPRESPALD